MKRIASIWHFFGLVPGLGFGALAALPVLADEHLPTISIDRRVVVLSDLAILPDHIAARHGSRAVVRLPRGAVDVEMTEDRRRQLLRRQIPGTQLRLRHSGTIRFQPEISAETGAERDRASTGSHRCFSLRASREPGQLILRDHVEQVECRNTADLPALDYVADAGALAARQPMASGDYLGAVRIADRGSIAAGSELKLVARQGPVTIIRDVTTLQAATDGARVFVRTAQGDVLAVPFSARKTSEQLHQNEDR